MASMIMIIVQLSFSDFLVDHIILLGWYQNMAFSCQLIMISLVLIFIDWCFMTFKFKFIITAKFLLLTKQLVMPSDSYRLIRSSFLAWLWNHTIRFIISEWWDITYQLIMISNFLMTISNFDLTISFDDNEKFMICGCVL